MKSKKLAYVTYQTFPADTANSLQTISNIVEMTNQGLDVELIFPNRDVNSSQNIEDLKEYYNFKQTFSLTRTDHNLPFGKFNFLNKFLYHISHYLWAKSTVSNMLKSRNFEFYFTRSDWVFYFLSIKNKNVIFECHQPSKLRNFILNKCLKNKHSKVIFLNSYLKEHYEKSIKHLENAIVLNNGYRDNLFIKDFKKYSNQVVFVGELLRFGSSRNIEFILSCFEDPRLDNFTLKIVGGPASHVEKLESKIKKTNISFLGRQNHKSTIDVLLESEIGILINSSRNIHSTNYTSPLKYFEYLAARLKIVAVDFKSHRNLPYADNMLFFQEENKQEFIQNILDSKNIIPVEENDFKILSISERVKKIIDFARLEGLEPPTL